MIHGFVLVTLFYYSKNIAMDGTNITEIGHRHCVKCAKKDAVTVLVLQPLVSLDHVQLIRPSVSATSHVTLKPETEHMGLPAAQTREGEDNKHRNHSFQTGFFFVCFRFSWSYKDLRDLVDQICKPFAEVEHVETPSFPHQAKVKNVYCALYY